MYYYLVNKVLEYASIITADAQQMIDEMQRMAPGKQYLKLQYGIIPITPGQKQNIIYSNRLHNPLYRIGKVIELFAEFSKNHPEWILKIAATGSGTEELQEKVRELQLTGTVHFLGWLSNEENRLNYESATIYISIPESDGTAVSLLEAMSAGCIPVVSDLPANREWIEDGKNGVIYNGKDNPLERALLLNSTEVQTLNEALITNCATRQASIRVFNELYTQIQHGK